MFDSLDEQMKHDAAVANSRQEVYMKYLLIAVASVVVFGVVFAGVWMMG